jgi:hypothetical protein
MGLALGLAGCFAREPTLDGGNGPDGGVSPSPANPSGPIGVSCGQDPTSGVTLCLGTTACPNLEIDPSTMPGCGFKTTRSPFDLECVCNGNSLCPMGVASSCSQVKSLIGNRSVADICSQVGVGSCVDVSGAPSAGTASGSGGASSTCDQNCAADCASNPTCLVACGC